MKHVGRIIAERDFSKKTIQGLLAQGIILTGTQLTPGEGPLPMADARRAYLVDDNGTGRCWDHAGVIAKAQEVEV